jgi:hypothetical protein
VFERATLSDEDATAEGRLVRTIGIDEHGARAIEVWRAPEDARRFAETSAPSLDELPAPCRVFGFEVTTFEVA